MIFDLRDPGQRREFITSVATHELLYGNAYATPLGGGLALLLEPWPNPAVRR